MKILYDHQIFEAQKFGGISRYFVELMTRLPKQATVKNSILFNENIYLRNSNLKKGLELPNFKGRNHVIHKFNNLNSKRILSQGDFDLFHPTYYDPYFLKNIKKPYVVTVYDMIHEKFSEMFCAKSQTKELKKNTILNANRIIAISQNTKHDLMDIYGIQEDKIDIVYLGHSIDHSKITPVDDIPENYILFVGQRGGYKNFKKLVEGYALIHQQFKDIKLVCTGTPFTSEELKLFHSLGLNDCVKSIFVSDSQLTYLYKKANCFVYPSLYEGFGIPILEAFAAGCPLALSNTSCFPEIAREGGEYFDPNDTESIADTLTRIIESSDLRKDLISRGKKVLTQYSWDKMANETYEIYKKILS